MEYQNPLHNTLGLSLITSVIGILAITLAPFSALATAQDYTPDFPKDYYEYESSKYGILIPYPENWNAFAVDDSYWFFQFSPVIESDDDLFQDGVFIGVQTVFPNTALTSYVNSYIESLENDDIDFELLESLATEIDGISAHKIEYYATSRGDSPMYEVAYGPSQYQTNVKIKVLEVTFIENEKAYTINYAAERQKFDDYKGVVENMIKFAKIDTSTTVTNNQVSGNYANKNIGLEIDFPEDWIGYENTQEDAIKPAFPYDTMVVVKPKLTNEGNEGQYIMILSGDLQKYIEEVKKIEDENPCQNQTFYISMVNNAKVYESLDNCTIDDFTFTEKNYVGIGDDRISFIAYSGTTDASFKNGIEPFENSIRTLQLDNTIDLSDTEQTASALDNEFNSYNVTINDKPTSVDTMSTSQITKFDFSYDKPGVTLSLTESNPWGATDISLDGILEGPYTILIDEQPTNKTYFLVDITNNNRTFLSIEYTNGSHEIAIIGTKVMPEFPFHAVALVTVAIGLILFITRGKAIFRRFP